MQLVTFFLSFLHPPLWGGLGRGHSPMGRSGRDLRKKMFRNSKKRSEPRKKHSEVRKKCSGLRKKHSEV